MSNRLKTYILRLIISEKPVDVTDEVYQVVFSHIVEYLDDICSYVFRSSESECVLRSIPLSDENIVQLITPTYCVKRAYEYLLYLQNAHENAHEVEQVFLAR